MFRKKLIKLILMVVVLSPLFAKADQTDILLQGLASANTVAQSANKILEESDYARGGNVKGLSFEIVLKSFRGDELEKSYKLRIESDSNNSLATFMEPARSKGIKMLMRGRNLWFLSLTTKKPVPISPRQRLLGEASNGDIATTNYSRDYDATLVGEKTVDGNECYVLLLKAKAKDVMYDKIVYYVDKHSKLGLVAEYYTITDKKLKTAMLEYGNTFEYRGREVNFVKRMQIVDELNANNKTVMEYGGVAAKKIPPSRFNKRLLMRN